MGEIADMMLDGTLCEGCGGTIDDPIDADIPDYCSMECAKDRNADWWIKANKKHTRV